MLLIGCGIIKTIKFLLSKIIIVEVMIIILYFSTIIFNVHIDVIDMVIEFFLKVLTPIAVVSIIPYILLSILDNKLISVIFGIIVLIFVFCYIFKILGV